MIVGILQPSYLPWLGFFEQMWRADVFVLYDDVQFEKGGWRNRNRIKAAGEPLWLTVPVLTKGRGEQTIRDVLVNRGVDWQKKHVRSLALHYAKAPFFADYAPELFAILERDWELLLSLNLELIGWLCGVLGITTRTVRASELGIAGCNTGRLVAIIKALGGDVFYEGSAGRNYINPDEFLAQGIEVRFQDYVHPVYQQLGGTFVSHLSIVDLLFNHGPRSLAILSRGKAND